ncbi:MAG: hypothetical protein ABSE90_03025 [Verrucomicrobiota bacterium]|jgi:hypothetical protein
MKTTRYLKWTVLALALANGWPAAAQSNRVPGPNDYGRFSSFITERNIFNPNRYAIYSPTSGPVRPRPVPRNAPTFTLVGTMSYEKGMFAFFDGNQSNLRKVLYQSESNNIAGFTLAEITLAGVKLQAADKKQIVELKIGQGMQQQGSSWQLASSGGFFGGGNGDFGGRNRGFDSTSSGESAAPATDNSSPDASAAPSPALEGNDVLKKLMQQRQQELK